MCIIHIYHYNCACDLTGESFEDCPKKGPPTYGPYTAPSTQACGQSERIIHKLEEECPHCVWALQDRDDEPAPAVPEKQAEQVARMMGQLRIREEGGQEVGDRELQARDERGQREKQAEEVARMMGQLRICEDGGQEVGDPELQARDERAQSEREWIMGMSVWGDEEVVGKWGNWLLDKEG